MVEKKRPQNPTSEDQVAKPPGKFEAWKHANFDRINSAIADSGVVDSMHELFSARGLDEIYMTFDATEYGAYFPIPVRSRYIVPLVDDGLELDEPHPGIAIYEECWPGLRTLSIQFGLGQEELEKVVSRGRAIRLKEQDGWGERRPDWWNLPQHATDMTREYDLGDDKDVAMEALSVEPNEKSRFWQVYSWSKITGFKRVVFETEKEEGQPQKEWGNDQEEITKALQSLATIIDSKMTEANTQS